MAWSVDWWTVLGWAGFGIGVVVAAWALLWDRARGRKRCPKCWYDLAGAKVGEVNALRCPECGRVVKRERELRRTRRRWRWGVPALVVMVLGLIAGSVHDPAGVRSRGWVALAPTPLLVMIAPVGKSAWEMSNSQRDFDPQWAQPRDPLLKECVHRLYKDGMWEVWSQILIDRWLAEPGVRNALMRTRDVWPQDALAGVAWFPPRVISGDYLIARFRAPDVYMGWRYSVQNWHDTLMQKPTGWINRVYLSRTTIGLVPNRAGSYRVDIEWWLPEVVDQGGGVVNADAVGSRRIWRGSMEVRVVGENSSVLMEGVASDILADRVREYDFEVVLGEYQHIGNLTYEYGYALHGNDPKRYIRDWPLDGPFGVNVVIEQDGIAKLTGRGRIPGRGLDGLWQGDTEFAIGLNRTNAGWREGGAIDLGRAYTIVVRGNAAESCSYTGNMKYWDGEVRIEVDPGEKE